MKLERNPSARCARARARRRPRVRVLHHTWAGPRGRAIATGMGIRPVMRYASTILLVAATFVVDGCAGTAAARKDGVAAPAPLPQPLAFWTFQEPTGAPRVSTRARHSYALADGDAAHPVESTSSEGLFGPRAVNFTATSPTQRLRAVRSAVPALTTDLAGPEAVVSVVAWVKRPTGRYFHGFLAGVW
jgi:hypothetical protein